MNESEIPAATIEGAEPQAATPDSALPDWLGRLPDKLRPFASLSRWDRPVGIWLLVLPCWIGIAFTRIGAGWHWIDLWWALLFFVGAVAMRGAGCTWNDLMDKDLDAGVERTASRPLPSGQVSNTQAYIWLAAQLFVGFLILLCLPFGAKITALIAAAFAAAYPFMKRLTWWPQAFLGFTFNWGLFVAAATVGYVSMPTVILFFALVCWTIAYDTIYALQDIEDDEIVGIKSTARLFADRAVLASFSFHIAAAALAGFATWAVGAGRIGALTMMGFLGHGAWQALRLQKNREENALGVFKSNVWAGAILCAGLALAAWIGGDRRPVISPPVTEVVEETADTADETTEEQIAPVEESTPAENNAETIELPEWLLPKKDAAD